MCSAEKPAVNQHAVAFAILLRSKIKKKLTQEIPHCRDKNRKRCVEIYDKQNHANFDVGGPYITAAILLKIIMYMAFFRNRVKIY